MNIQKIIMNISEELAGKAGESWSAAAEAAKEEEREKKEKERKRRRGRFDGSGGGEEKYPTGIIERRNKEK